MRPDRIATLYLFHPWRRISRRTFGGIPILMYHSISSRTEVRTNPYFHTCTDPGVFRHQLGLLAGAGYRTIGLNEAVGKLQSGTRSSEKLVVLTFDDGYEDFYTEAFPVLSSLGYTATVFLPTGYIADSQRKFNETTCLTWNQVRELHKAGIEFGSHTVTHPELRTLPAVDLDRELRSSKEEIEHRLGCRATSFSYPYAFPEPDGVFRQRLRSNLLAVGYENGVSTIVGTAGSMSDRLFLERIPVNSSDDATLFEAKLQGGYDWLHTLQFTSKLRLPHIAGA